MTTVNKCRTHPPVGLSLHILISFPVSINIEAGILDHKVRTCCYSLLVATPICTPSTVHSVLQSHTLTVTYFLLCGKMSITADFLDEALLPSLAMMKFLFRLVRQCAQSCTAGNIKADITISASLVMEPPYEGLFFLNHRVE